MLKSVLKNMADAIKDAFAKVKQDILDIQSEISNLTNEIRELKRTLDRQTINPTNNPTIRQTLRQINPTQEQVNQTEKDLSTHSSTGNLPLERVKSSNLDISTRNKGVSTDRQTDQQTDTSTGNEGVKFAQSYNSTHSSTHIPTHKAQIRVDKLHQLSEFLASLDDIKKELRSKVKKLTNQEMQVLQTLYELEEKGFIVDYLMLSTTLNLTESSIRDYIQRILKKGIPIEKIRENNKKIFLSLSNSLRKIVSLPTLIQLRSL